MQKFNALCDALILQAIPTSDSVGEVEKCGCEEKPKDMFNQTADSYVDDNMGDIEDTTQPDDDIGLSGNDIEDVSEDDGITENEDGSVVIKLSDDGNELHLNAAVISKLMDYFGVERLEDESEEGSEEQESTEEDSQESEPESEEVEEQEEETEDEIKTESIEPPVNAPQIQIKLKKKSSTGEWVVAVCRW